MFLGAPTPQVGKDDNFFVHGTEGTYIKPRM